MRRDGAAQARGGLGEDRPEGSVAAEVGLEVVKHGRGQDVVADRHNRRGGLLGRVGILMIE